MRYALLMTRENNGSALYSIGHSTLPIDDFIALLRRHEIQAIGDVRSAPYSRFNPQYSKDALEGVLRFNGIAYVFLGKELGGRRVFASEFGDRKVDYDRVAKTDSFRSGLRRLRVGASKMKVAMLCAEKDPLTCHRTILIARYLKEMVPDILHIHHDGSIETQEEVEERLLAESNLKNTELFRTREQLIHEAYHKRELAIAYEEPEAHGSH